MLESVLQTPNSVGYVSFPTLESFNAHVFTSNFTQLAICTVIEDHKCANSVILDEALQYASLNAFVVQENGAAMAPPFNWTCEDCWFFNGFTYWYTEEQYSESGCNSFISDLFELFNWIYTNPTAMDEAQAAHFVLLQGETWNILQSNFNKISCAKSVSSALDHAFFIAWLVVMIIFLIFTIVICIRLLWGVNKKYQRIRSNPVTFSLQSEGPMEVTPLLMKAQIDCNDIILSDQIGTGSFGEVCFLFCIETY